MQENEKKEPCCCCAHKTKHRSEEEYKSLVHRLNRIEGQIRGIRGMVENEVYCPDILVQSAAVTAAMNAFNRELLANHIRACVADDIFAEAEHVLNARVFEPANMPCQCPVRLFFCSQTSVKVCVTLPEP